jgi:hypothetical protein
VFVAVREALDLATSKMGKIAPKRGGRAVKATEGEKEAAPKMSSKRKHRAVEEEAEEEEEEEEEPPKRKRRVVEDKDKDEESKKRPKRKAAKTAVKPVEEDEEEDEDEEEQVLTERAQKRTKREKPADIVDDMEDLMNDLGPSGIHVDRSMFDIPRDLLNSGTSMSTLDTELKEFEEYFQQTYELVCDELQETQGKDREQSQFIFQFVERISS